MDDQCVSHSSPQRGGGQAGIEIHRQGRPSVIRCGWLRKQGGFVKTWHSRWFVLRGDQLYYYKDEEETKALGKLAHLSAIEIFILLIYPHFFVWRISQQAQLSQTQATSAAEVSEG